jgi:hypothetical protein
MLSDRREHHDNPRASGGGQSAIWISDVWAVWLQISEKGAGPRGPTPFSEGKNQVSS